MGRLACWIIVAGNESTAFRAATPDELIPTLKQLRRTQPDATLKWFAKGKLWDSPEQALAAEQVRRPRRSKSWRPGGNHSDPRARYTLTRDQKRARFKRRLRDEGNRQEPKGERPKSTRILRPRKRSK